MPLGFSRAAEFGVGEGNEIVDEIDGTHAGLSDPAGKAAAVQPGVTDVEIEAVSPIASGATEPSQRSADKRGSEMPWRVAEKVEQYSRRLAIEDPSKARVLDDGLRLTSKMLQIGQADAIDPGRLTIGPTAPDEPAHVEQQGRVVGQEPA